MSTNAVIHVEGSDVELYKHWDGYPSATLEWLENFNKDFTERRGNDVDYKMAQLVRSSVRDSDEYGLDDNDLTGWGITTKGVYGYEYIYTLNADGTVTVGES